MKVLLSIRPEFAERIFAGTKRYEFRRGLFRTDTVRTVVVYVTKPVALIVGEFDVGGVIEDAPDALWRRTAAHAGIERAFFDEYFAGRAKGYAIAIERPRTFDQPLSPRSLISDFTPPQSYMYVSDAIGRIDDAAAQMALL